MVYRKKPTCYNITFLNARWMMIQVESFLLKKHTLKSTPIRIKLLKILVGSQSPLSAYELLERLKAQHATANIMSVYRILKLFETQGLVHRLNQSSRYIVCDDLYHHHICAGIIVCPNCHQFKEIHDGNLSQQLKQFVTNHGFHLKSAEIKALCKTCQAEIA